MTEAALAPLSLSESSLESGHTQATVGSLGEHIITVYSDTEAVSHAVFVFLQGVNSEKLPETYGFKAHWFTTKEVAVETEITALQHELEQTAPKESRQTPERALQDPAKRPEAKKPEAEMPRRRPGERQTFPSLFSMARAFAKQPMLRRHETETTPPKEPRTPEKSTRHDKALPGLTSRAEPSNPIDTSKTRDQEGQQRQGQDQEEQRERGQGKKRKLSGVQASNGTPAAKRARVEDTEGDEIGNLFVRFMALMARVLGQAEAEAHALYQKIKHRTDQIDRLTLLISKINSTGGDIDWSKNEEMKKLVDEVRAIGVDIPEGKYAWSEDEKKLLKENIDMRKDSMEKITQLERTDMQRYLQEASQCHQARSNVLKLLKEVTDTIIHNIKP